MGIKTWFVLFLIFFALPVGVFASVPEIGQSQISPASAGYFLKMVKEDIELKLAQTDNVKFMRQMEFAVRRLREVKSLISEKREDLIEPNLIKYQDHIKKLERYSSGNQDLQVLADERIATHINLLISLYPNIKNTRAQLSIRAAVQNLEKRNRQEIKRLDKDLRAKVWGKTSLTQKLACEFLQKESTNSVLTQAEKKLVNIKAEECKEFLNNQLLESSPSSQYN
ncbi:hypothetical protein HYW42_00345 [Candidatus Daviesbacteria bacterium]|nr:hypothetical protein [Candidatus Daviesbacteria bacterium]